MKNNLLDVFETRYSCRSYTGEQITQKELEFIINAGNAAPIGMNRVKDIQINVVQDQYILQELELCGQHLFQKMGMNRSVIYGAPTLIIISVKKLEAAFERAQICSAACILENMSLAATDLSLGSVYLSGVTTALNNNKELLHKLQIPDDYEAVSAIAVGKTDIKNVHRDLTKEKFHLIRQ